jgi:glutamine amidotransferase
VSVAVVKLGVGNTASVMFALDRLGARARLSDEPRVIADAERVILPGVGAAAFAMEKIAVKRLLGTLRRFERPLLGLCLGQQLLFDESDEGEAKGLGLIPGRVTRLPQSAANPLPHMGWSRLSMTRESPLTEGVADGAYVYFVHSYVCPLNDATIATATYGRTLAAMVADGNRYGCQFHPERSGRVGARILENFLALPC